MAGINLSQSNETRKVSGKALVDTGLIVLVVFTTLVVLVWGGLRVYMYTVNKEIASLQASIDGYGAQLKGDKVDRVADMSERLAYMEKNNGEAINVPDLMRQLERLTIPEISITKYEYDNAEKLLHISGTTTNFRFVAQQLTSFREESPLENIQIEKLGNIDKGKISFILKTTLDK
ncbi:MAG: hypothetical protein AAB519_04175 [Patescibacteria group bacterium]